MKNMSKNSEFSNEYTQIEKKYSILQDTLNNNYIPKLKNFHSLIKGINFDELGTLDIPVGDSVDCPLF